MLLVMHRKLTDQEIDAAGVDIKEKARQFFQNNPRRRVCHAGIWYNQHITIRRKHIDADVDEAVTKAKAG